MDGFAALFAGGKSGKPAIVAGQVSQSELVRRMLLEPTDEKVMPPRKRPRPTASEVALLRWWIKQGADRDLLISAVKDAPKDVAAVLADSALDESGEVVYVPRVGDYSHLQSEIETLEADLGIKLVRVSRQPGDGLILRTRGAEKRFGDAELARLATIAPFIVEAELTGTAITDAGIAAFKTFAQLTRLHLDRTQIEGHTLGELSALKNLAYLNLCATQVTDDTLASLGAVNSLRQLYVFGSRVTRTGVAELKTRLPECQIGPVEIPQD
jgi:hypothetical protein